MKEKKYDTDIPRVRLCLFRSGSHRYFIRSCEPDRCWIGISGSGANIWEHEVVVCRQQPSR